MASPLVHVPQGGPVHPRPRREELATDAGFRWTTAEGREIPVHEMTDAHLANALRYMKTWAVKKAAAASSREIVDWTACVSPRFAHLRREAEARHLEWEVVNHEIIGIRSTCQLPIDDRTCTADAVMWTTTRFDGKQQLRCADHRDDLTDDRRVICDGCLKREGVPARIRRGFVICQGCELATRAREQRRIRRRRWSLATLVTLVLATLALAIARRVLAGGVATTRTTTRTS